MRDFSLTAAHEDVQVRHDFYLDHFPVQLFGVWVAAIFIHADSQVCVGPKRAWMLDSKQATPTGAGVLIQLLRLRIVAFAFQRRGKGDLGVQRRIVQCASDAALPFQDRAKEFFRLRVRLTESTARHPGILFVLT